MKFPQSLLWVSAGVAGLCLLGCAHNHAYVEQQPQRQYVIAREAPPPVVVERRPSPPSHLHIWIDGYWHWNAHKYVWRRGHWALPPHERAVWVAPRYERHDKGYRYTPAQWREEGKNREGDRQQRRDGH